MMVRSLRLAGYGPHELKFLFGVVELSPKRFFVSSKLGGNFKFGLPASVILSRDHESKTNIWKPIPVRIFYTFVIYQGYDMDILS